jgi:hypothetical protein
MSMQSITTPRSAARDRDLVTLIVSCWRAMKAIAGFTDAADRRDPWTRAAPARDPAVPPWYDDPCASRGL